MLLWPVIGAIVVGLWSGLRNWAYEGDTPNLWNSDEEQTAIRMGLAAFWPLTLSYSIIVYPSMAIIHRLF